MSFLTVLNVFQKVRPNYAFLFSLEDEHRVCSFPNDLLV